MPVPARKVSREFSVLSLYLLFSRCWKTFKVTILHELGIHIGSGASVGDAARLCLFPHLEVMPVKSSRFVARTEDILNIWPNCDAPFTYLLCSPPSFV